MAGYQADIGYYNWAFQSAAWMQTTANRPLVMEYASNGGILPTQAVGVSITGAIPSGQLGLNYVFEYGSSDTIRPDINGSGLFDFEHNGNHVNLGLFMRPDSLPGLQIGGSFYHDKISDTVRSQGVRYGQTIVNGKSFAEKRTALHSLCRRLDCSAKPFSYFRARSLSSRPKM